MNLLSTIEQDHRLTLSQLADALRGVSETTWRIACEIEELGTGARLPDRGIVRNDGIKIDLLCARARYLKDLLVRFGESSNY